MGFHKKATREATTGTTSTAEIVVIEPTRNMPESKQRCFSNRVESQLGCGYPPPAVQLKEAAAADSRAIASMGGVAMHLQGRET